MFDTLSYSEDLTDAGVPEKQAKLQAKVLSGAFESNDLATKTDITELRADVKTQISGLETQMAEMELRIIKWQIGGIGLVIAAMKFL